MHYQIVHSTAGRFRIRVPQLATDSEYASKLNRLVNSYNFVTHVRINPNARSLIVNYDTSAVDTATAQDKIFSSIENANIVEISPLQTLEETEVPPPVNYWERLSLPVLGLGAALLAEPLGLSLSLLVIGGLITAAAVPIFTRGINGITEEKKLKVDVLDSLWILFHTFLNGQYIAPSLMIALSETGMAVRENASRSEQRQVIDLLHLSDRYAWVQRDEEEEQILLKEVKVGDKVIVHTGELIPVDGQILHIPSERAVIDQYDLTGVEELVDCYEGQEVYASSLVAFGKLWVIAKRTGKDTRAALISEFVNGSDVHKTEAENYAMQVAESLVVPTLLMSSGIFALTGNIALILPILQLDFGTGISISVPTTVLNALTCAARNGVYIRNGRVLEKLAQVDTVVFDKTGTLTQGNAAVVAVYTAAYWILPSQMLSLAASAKQGIDHPAAKAIVDYAEEKGIQSQECEIWDYRIGMGVAAQINGQQILVGSKGLMEQARVDLDPIHQRYPHLTATHHSLVYVAKEGELLGVILYSDPVRPESSSTIDSLRSHGIEPYILTGDRPITANDLAERLGIEPSKTYAGAVPAEKVEVVSRLHNEGRMVACVGDGLNDSMAFAHADVSVLFASGMDIAGESADIVLMDNDLRGLIHGMEIAKRAMEIVHQNIAVVTVPNISVVLAGVFLGLHPISAVLINNCASLIAELNGFQPLLDGSQNTDSQPLRPNISQSPVPTYDKLILS
ncbi:MAG: heavy metal translocating P-type ATPase [Xenococcaceae cyanobacterium]